MTLREAIVFEARRWLGTPFHHGARVLGAGVDCVNLLAAVYEAVGLVRNVALPKYSPDWMLHRADDRLRDGLRRVAVKVDGDPEPGDIAVFQVGRAVAHAAIVVEWPLVIHADSRLKVVALEDASRSALLASHFAGSWSIVAAARTRVEVAA